MVWMFVSRNSCLTLVSGLFVKIIVVVITATYTEKYSKGDSSYLLYGAATGSEHIQVYIFEHRTHLLRFIALLTGLYIPFFKGALG